MNDELFPFRPHPPTVAKPGDVDYRPPRPTTRDGALDKLIDDVRRAYTNKAPLDMVWFSDVQEAREAIYSYVSTAVQEERDACAKIADGYAEQVDFMRGTLAAQIVAKAIRERSFISSEIEKEKP